MGAGRGQGDRPEEKTNTSSYDAATKPKLNPGQAAVVDLVPGQNAKGEAQIEISAALEAAGAAAPDALNNQKLPRSYKEHAKSYFDRIREGR